MKGSIRFDREAVKEMYQIERQLIASLWHKLDELAINPDASNYQSDSEDPSLYWAAVEGDHLIFFEIIDEEHAILVVSIR